MLTLAVRAVGWQNATQFFSSCLSSYTIEDIKIDFQRVGVHQFMSEADEAHKIWPTRERHQESFHGSIGSVYSETMYAL
jgi:hypothetical protein